MKRNAPYIISIPKPCRENWEQMTATEKGRFCSSCQQQVIDLTGLSDQQVLKILRSGQLKCGRFLNTQLERPLISASDPSFFRPRFIQKIAASLMFFQAIGHTSLAQTPTGDIRGKLVDKSGQPIVSAYVQAKIGEKLYAVALTDTTGNFEIRPLPTGSYDIIVKSIDHYDTTLKDIVVVADTSTVLDANMRTRIYTREEIAVVGGIYVARRKTFWQRINIFRRRE